MRRYVLLKKVKKLKTYFRCKFIDLFTSKKSLKCDLI